MGILVHFERAEHATKPGTWALEGRIPTFKIVVVVCPECNHAFMLSKKVHTVDSDGFVRPSLVCPHDHCKFHELVQLDGWSEPDPRTR